mmetsp:Transcript_22719/g.51418  ORF Transcript_22719/g.51418 Transcript_22719/m.51418 type:complete len:84 (+) Transcript_22719:208-459(+)
MDTVSLYAVSSLFIRCAESPKRRVYRRGRRSFKLTRFQSALSSPCSLALLSTLAGLLSERKAAHGSIQNGRERARSSECVIII